MQMRNGNGGQGTHASIMHTDTQAWVR
jgi:hypothetical protein